MAWVVVPNLDELRDQLNTRFPNRDKSSDGSIGDTSHAAASSSHNPDKTGSPEYRDGDSKDEVRARDIDSDLRDAGGVTMEQVTQTIITRARAGRLPHLRYWIFNGRIWHKRDNYVTRNYTGSDKHTNHAHANSDFTQAADEARGVDWGLGVIAGTPVSDKHLDVDGELGPKTISKWQQVMGTAVDGVITPGNSDLVRAVQRRLRATVNPNLSVDGDGIYQNNQYYKTAAALQTYLGTGVDGKISSPVSQAIKALQRRLNDGWF